MRIKRILLGLLAAVATFACQPVDTPVEKPKLELSSSKYTISELGDEKVLYITANNAWSIEADVDWISFNQDSGEAADEEQMVKVYIDPNEDYEQRTGQITVTSGELTQTVPVTQTGKEREPEVTGTGTQTDPYILSTAKHMVRMRELATEDGETWFKMDRDIDMAGVTDYIPVNNDGTFSRKIHFDGGNFTVSNFTCDDADRPYPSLFGVLYGSCRDLKVTNATIVSKSNVAGILGGYVGTAEKPAEVTNVDVQGTVKSEAVRAGGFAGNVVGSTFTDCNADITVNGTQDAGGFVGKVEGASSFTRCNATVHVTTAFAGNARSGGFIGWNAGSETTITDCHVLAGSALTHDASLDAATDTSCGGFIGYGDGAAGNILKVSGCSADIDMITVASGLKNSCFIGQLGYASNVSICNTSVRGKVEGEQNYHAGLIGDIRASDVTVENCSFTGTVKGRAGVGGLVGAVENNGLLKISKSKASGTISNLHNNCGGLVGLVAAGTSVEITDSHFEGTVSPAGYGGGIVGGAQGKCVLKRTWSTGAVSSNGAYTGGLIGAAMHDDITISDCFSTAKVSGWGQQVGGLVGTTTNKLTMTNCYASGDVYSATSGAAGLVGRVAKSSVIKNCIAWNKNVSTSRTADNVYAPGAILGCAQEKGTYSGCWRRYDMTLVDEWIVLYDQPDYIDTMPPLPSYSTATHQQAYHGKAASEDATLASVAQSLGWDAEIWDFASMDSSFGFTIKVLGDNKIEF